MSNEEILKKAIAKAVKNGWVKYPEMSLGREYMPLWTIKDWIREHGFNSIIFSHEFAKAFWGEKHMYYEGKNADDMIGNQKAYIYHLQEMVKEEEPLKYLEKFLDV